MIYYCQSASIVVTPWIHVCMAPLSAAEGRAMPDYLEEAERLSVAVPARF